MLLRCLPVLRRAEHWTAAPGLASPRIMSSRCSLKRGAMGRQYEAVLRLAAFGSILLMNGRGVVSWIGTSISTVAGLPGRAIANIRSDAVAIKKRFEIARGLLSAISNRMGATLEQSVFSHLRILGHEPCASTLAGRSSCTSRFQAGCGTNGSAWLLVAYGGRVRNSSRTATAFDCA